MARSVELDLERVSRLEQVLGTELSDIIGSLVRNMADTIGQLERALDAGRLEHATQAAHLCRNDALMVGARPLLETLGDVESAAREHQLEPAREALARVREVWPSTRDELERVAGTTPGQSSADSVAPDRSSSADSAA
jgi:hypothetical protein